MYDLGAQFDLNVSLNYTRLNLYGQEPELLGNYSQIFQGKNQTLINDIREFYRGFQKRTDYLEQLIEIYTDFAIKKKYYFFYNDLYWFINLKAPYVKITYEKIPLPGTENLKAEIEN